MEELTKKVIPGGTVIVQPAGLELIHYRASEGSPHTQIAAALGIAPNTFRALVERDPAVREALAKGNARNEEELVGLLMEKARSGNIVASMFLLKAKHGYREGEPRESGHRPNVVIMLNAAAKEAEYLLADVEVKEIEKSVDDPEKKG